ncbi:hypothetical protein [Spirochaeta africana]|uniref:hypothetical protein n=1 Tax=Spirochaeta africana TaxID=46355 RepID=UPI00059C9688|nr:hypothetical protein [Spirochaeta africana]
MKPGEWYKVFGGPQQTTYYHVLSVDEDVVRVEAYEYQSVLQRIRSISRYGIPAKDWMEQEAENEIHPVPKAQVPFVIPV